MVRIMGLSNLYTLAKDGTDVVSKGGDKESFNFGMEERTVKEFQFSCGLGTIVDGDINPFVAVNIKPQFFVQLKPHEKILLMFSQ